MTTNSQLSINEPKRKEKQLEQKLNKLEQEQNGELEQRNGHHMEGFQWGGEGRNRGKGTEKKKHNW